MFALPSRDNCSNALRNMPERIATADVLHRGSLLTVSLNHGVILHYGFKIVKTLIVDIDSDEHVKAMNEICSC